MQETWVWSLGWEDPLEKGKITLSSVLAWRIPCSHKELDTTEWLSLSNIIINILLYLLNHIFISLLIIDLSHFSYFIDADKIPLSMGFSRLENWSGREALDMSTVQFGSVTQSCLTPCDPMNHSTPGLPVHHQLPELIQTHVHWVRDAIQPSHPLSFPSPPAPNPSQHQGLFQRVNSSHEVAKVLEFQL